MVPVVGACCCEIWRQSLEQRRKLLKKIESIETERSSKRKNKRRLPEGNDHDSELLSPPAPK